MEIIKKGLLDGIIGALNEVRYRGYQYPEGTYKKEFVEALEKEGIQIQIPCYLEEAEKLIKENQYKSPEQIEYKVLWEIIKLQEKAIKQLQEKNNVGL